MDILAQFEYPLPVISASITRISAETSSGYDGSFIITNTGGGDLNGYITSNTDSVVFTPDKFSGNMVDVSYSFSADSFKPGDYVESSVLIVSNGGELVIPIAIEIIPPEIYAKDGRKITSLMDYMFYVKENPIASRQLFSQKEFMMWLLSMNCEHMDLYERFLLDSNKERAVDNFLIMNRLKRKAQLSLLQRSFEIRLKHLDTEPVTGIIPIKLNGWGFIDLQIRQLKKSGAIKLLTEKAAYSDFDENGVFEATYVIYPALMKKKISMEKIVLSGDTDDSCIVTVIREPAVEARLSKPGYGFSDKGAIIVNNHSGRDIKLEIRAGDTFLKFEGKRYFIGARAEIPFELKFTALQMAQLALKKQPVINTSVEIISVTDAVAFRKKLVINIGGIDVE